MVQTTPRCGLPYLVAGQAQKELTHNEALILIDALAGASAVSIGVNVPPVAASPGQCWIVGASPQGAWADHAEALACWTEGGWRFVTARQGMHVWVEDRQLWAIRDAAGWTVGEVVGERVVLSGKQIVGERLAAVPAPAGGTTQDTEARAAISTLIAKLVSHGLVEAG